MDRWQYTKGLHELGNGCFAYLQPDGSLGWSNAGIVAGEDSSMLIDTLFDLRLTREMLASMAAVTQGAPISTLVNTHANGDHCWGNELVEGAEIVASRACRDEMQSELKPADLAGLAQAEGLGAGIDYLRKRMRHFDFSGITLTLPTRVFDVSLSLEISGQSVELIEVGPAHTRGDTLVHVPRAKTVYTGDILFIDGTPIMWQGPVSNWIAACQTILEMDVETVVPGHGPVTDKNGVVAVRDYLVYIESEARKRFDAGLSVDEAARDIRLGDYSSWGDSERIAINVHTLYRGFSGDPGPGDLGQQLELLAELAVS